MFSKLTTKIALHKAGLSGISLPTTNYTKSYTSTTSTSKNGIAGTEASDSQYPAFLTTNPFANVTMPKALNSWVTPPAAPIPVAMAPEMGTRAPTNLKLRLPAGDGSPTVVVFLRHCGCPFAEKTFLLLRTLANKHPQFHFVAVSHSSPESTERWVRDLGGAWAVTVVVDEIREVYASWGLGISTTWHLLNPWTQWGMYKLGKDEGVYARAAGEGATRWQVGGAWAVDGRGVVRWGAPAKTADEVPILEDAVRAIMTM